MKLAIMQPYLFPYLGYFQLIHAVDRFVIYDDVNYIKGGWINRNQILSNGLKQFITLPLKGASPNKLINEIDIIKQHKILKSIKYNYEKSSYFKTVYPIIEDIFSYPKTNLANFLSYQLRRICDYLELTPDWLLSSSIKKNNNLHGVEKVLSICKQLDTTHYINSPGGQSLYQSSFFSDQEIQLSFIKTHNITYPQFGKEFVPHLSIIDVMMFNSISECKNLLSSYDLI